ncbi:TIGR04211 family SH3 domain-containing protein [Candidatus Contendibacter odensensis]|uniref:SH3b domain-containing protein n=1 Tax=Candidatus Contendobacter odensis Run_B_J11 TaxID=1400861 RepID=A0A7U7GD20_9GAMM|nr:TIGR04211 family SH3 domain-containing protein [Candidatus Contendobacter odensis]CDH45554.1 conserved exported hypothetical protein [Candidatus Contendobacter odensis Run_B_J11]
MKRYLLGGVLWVFVAGIVPASAEQGYVTDLCTVPLKSGAAPAYKIVRMVNSGTRLEILQPDTQGYIKVKTPEGISGWMMTQSLMNQPSARSRVEPLEVRVAALENENRILRGETEALNSARDASTRCNDELTTVRSTAAQTLAIDEENRQLHQDIAAARERQQQLEIENAALRDSYYRHWFLAGAGVAFGGLACGLLLPHLSWRRQRRWGQL